MHYRVFYLFNRSGESVSSASAVEMSARAIREQLLPRIQTDDDYLGIIDARETTLQILFEQSSALYWVELPIDEAKASFGRHMSFGELDALLDALPERFDQTAIPGLEYRPW